MEKKLYLMKQILMLNLWVQFAIRLGESNFLKKFDAKFHDKPISACLKVMLLLRIMHVSGLIGGRHITANFCSTIYCYYIHITLVCLNKIDQFIINL